MKWSCIESHRSRNLSGDSPWPHPPRVRAARHRRARRPPAHRRRSTPTASCTSSPPDGYAIHRLVYAAVATGGGRDFLYAPFALGGALHEVYVRRFDVATRFRRGTRVRDAPSRHADSEVARASAQHRRGPLEGCASPALARCARRRARLHASRSPEDAHRARTARDGEAPLRVQRLPLPRRDSRHRRGAVHPAPTPAASARAGRGAARCRCFAHFEGNINAHLPLHRHAHHPRAARVQPAEPARCEPPLGAAAHARAERRRPGGHRLPLGQHHPRRVPPRLRRGVARARGDSDAPTLPRAHRRGREGQRRGAARRLERARGLSQGRPLPRPVRGGALAHRLDSRTPRRRRGAPPTSRRSPSC